MDDRNTSAILRRTAISIEVFEGVDSESVKNVFEQRRRILSSLPREGRRRPALASGRASNRGVVAIWTVFAGNGRPIASSADVFSSEKSAARSAAATMARVADLELLRLRAPTPPAHAWAMRLDGIPRIISLRHFATPRLRDRNAASVLEALRCAGIAPTGHGRPHHRLLRSREPFGLDEDVLAQIAEPLKLRGAARPIKPIVRLYAAESNRVRTKAETRAETVTERNDER